jgi:hypothetical protein
MLFSGWAVAFAAMAATDPITGDYCGTLLGCCTNGGFSFPITASSTLDSTVVVEALLMNLYKPCKGIFIPPTASCWGDFGAGLVVQWNCKVTINPDS